MFFSKHAKGLLFGALLLGAALFFAGCGGGPADPGGTGSTQGEAPAGSGDAAANEQGNEKRLEPIKMTVGYTSTGLNYAEIFAAEALGIYEKYGLDVETQFVSSSSQAVPAIRSGSVDIVASPGNAAIDAIAEGITDLTMIGDVVQATILEVWVQPDINSVDDLVGKTISSTSPGSLGDKMTEVWLNKNGYEKSDVEIVYLGGLNNLVAGMRSGQTAATLILPPLGNQLESTGQKKLTDLRDIAYSNHAYIARKSWVDENPEAVERFLKASIEAIAVLKQEKERVLPVFPKYTGVEDPELNEYAYEFHKDLWEKVPKIKMDVMTATRDLSSNEKAHSINLEEYVDNSFIEKLEAEGFIDSLYK